MKKLLQTCACTSGCKVKDGKSRCGCRKQRLPVLCIFCKRGPSCENRGKEPASATPVSRDSSAVEGLVIDLEDDVVDQMFDIGASDLPRNIVIEEQNGTSDEEEGAGNIEEMFDGIDGEEED